MTVPSEAVRAVIDAARKLNSRVSNQREDVDALGNVTRHIVGMEYNAYRELLAAVTSLEDVLSLGESMPNKPTGFVLTRPWNLVPAGWFVKTPKGEWFEIVATEFADGKQEVSMKGPDGKRIGPFLRDPNREVSVRRGTYDKELGDAVEALSDVFGGTSIIRDGDWS